MRFLFASILVALTWAAQAQPLKKITLFGQPSVNNDAIWMALEHGYFKEQGLEVDYRVFPSGTTAFQTFRTGQGDIVMTGDLPSVQYFFNNPGQYQTFVAIERDAKGYVVIARKDIRTAKDLAGKTVATRVGSTGIQSSDISPGDHRPAAPLSRPTGLPSSRNPCSHGCPDSGTTEGPNCSSSS